MPPPRRAISMYGTPAQRSAYSSARQRPKTAWVCESTRPGVSRPPAQSTRSAAGKRARELRLRPHRRHLPAPHRHRRAPPARPPGRPPSAAARRPRAGGHLGRAQRRASSAGALLANLAKGLSATGGRSWRKNCERRPGPLSSCADRYRCRNGSSRHRPATVNRERRSPWSRSPPVARRRERFPGRPDERAHRGDRPHARRVRDDRAGGRAHGGGDGAAARARRGDPRGWRASGEGFGIVAGTGTGKTLAIRPMAEEIVGTPLRVGVVNREREATPETPTWNVVIVTTGIARRWLQDDLIGRRGHAGRRRDPPDLGGAGALPRARRSAPGAASSGSRPRWTPPSTREYLDSAEVIETSAFDPAKAADGARLEHHEPAGLPHRALPAARGEAEARGGRLRPHARGDGADRAGRWGSSWDRIFTEFYHGGEPVSKLRPFLEGDAPHPYLLSMTAAGPVGAQHPGAGHGGDRGRAVHHRGAQRQGRAHAAAAGRQRDPADGRAGARPGGGRRGVDPLGARHRLRGAASRPSPTSSSRATRSAWR